MSLQKWRSKAKQALEQQIMVEAAWPEDDEEDMDLEEEEDDDDDDEDDDDDDDEVDQDEDCIHAHFVKGECNGLERW